MVRDATGAAVPDAQVVVANENRGIRRTLQTNNEGIFTAPALVPSAGYSVNVTKAGFAAFDARNIEILVGQNINLNVELNVAAATTLVEVSDYTPIVEQTKTGVSQVVESNQIINLPINGRRVDSFVQLTPTVVQDGTFGLLSFRGIAGNNSFLTDGNDTTNQFYNENAGRTRIMSQISADAVQEFQVLSSGYSAEFGRASGGVINTVTRSGSNQTHGTAYWFFRNRSLNARDPFADYNPPEVRHQAGGSLGGKIVTDKLFYFANFELTRRDFPLIASLTRPPLFDATGRFVGTCAATPQQCQTASNFLDRQFQVLDRTANSNLAFAKIDWRPSERDSYSWSGNFMDWDSPNGIQTQAVLNNGNGIGNNANSTVKHRFARFAWTSILSSNIVNEFRSGYFKDRLYDYPNPDLVPALTGLIALTVQGQNNLGLADSYPRLNPSENRWQLADNLSWTRGKHTFKFGVDLISTQDYNSILRNQYGTYTYPTFTAFAQDLSGNTTGEKRWQNFSQRFGNPVVDTTIRDYNFYLQDQWRITRGLTLNYGLRYEYSQLPQPEVTNPDYAATGRIPTDKNNVAPRIGFAYALNDDKTVVRGGYGVFYARYPGGLINTFFLENGVYQRQFTLTGTVPADLAVGPVFPNRLASLDRTPPAQTLDITLAADNFRTPYTQQADIGIERQLTRDLGLTVSYIWSRGLLLPTVQDVNIGAPGGPVTYRINDAAGNQVGTYTTPISYLRANAIDKRYRRVNVVDNGGNSYYNALAVQMRKRYSRGIEASVAYTWSHAIDYNQGGGNDNIFFSNGPRSLENGNYRLDKSSSALDQRHRAVITTIWTPKFTSSTSAWARFFVNNWQISQITTLASAQPATPTIFVSGTPFAGAAINSSLNGFGGSSRVPFLPAASLDIDQVYRMDARLSKQLPFTERFQLWLQFEAFNVTNSPYFTSVNTQAFQATNGVLTPTPRLGEGSATQGFPDGTNARRAQASLRVVF